MSDTLLRRQRIQRGLDLEKRLQAKDVAVHVAAARPSFRKSLAKARRVMLRSYARIDGLTVQQFKKAARSATMLYIAELLAHGTATIPHLGTLRMARSKRTKWNSVIRGRISATAERATIERDPPIHVRFRPAKAMRHAIIRATEEGQLPLSIR